MLREIVNCTSVLLDGIILLLVSGLMIIQLVIDLLNLLTRLRVSLQSFVLLRLDQVVDAGAGLADVVHDVVGGVLDAGLGVLKVLDLLLKILILDVLKLLDVVVVLLKHGLVRLDNILVVRFQKFESFKQSFILLYCLVVIFGEIL